MQDEIVKDNMVKWMHNFGHTIDTEAWTKIGKGNMKMSTSVAFKENLYKTFYKWYITPER